MPSPTPLAASARDDLGPASTPPPNALGRAAAPQRPPRPRLPTPRRASAPPRSPPLAQYGRRNHTAAPLASPRLAPSPHAAPLGRLCANPAAAAAERLERVNRVAERKPAPPRRAVEAPAELPASTRPLAKPAPAAASRKLLDPPQCGRRHRAEDRATARSKARRPRPTSSPRASRASRKGPSDCPRRSANRPSPLSTPASSRRPLVDQKPAGPAVACPPERQARARLAAAREPLAAAWPKPICKSRGRRRPPRHRKNGQARRRTRRQRDASAAPPTRPAVTEAEAATAPPARPPPPPSRRARSETALRATSRRPRCNEALARPERAGAVARAENQIRRIEMVSLSSIVRIPAARSPKAGFASRVLVPRTNPPRTTGLSPSASGGPHLVAESDLADSQPPSLPTPQRDELSQRQRLAARRTLTRGPPAPRAAFETATSIRRCSPRCSRGQAISRSSIRTTPSHPQPTPPPPPGAEIWPSPPARAPVAHPALGGDITLTASR